MGQSREPFISLLLYHLFVVNRQPHAQHLLRGRIYGTEHVPAGTTQWSAIIVTHQFFLVV